MPAPGAGGAALHLPAPTAASSRGMQERESDSPRAGAAQQEGGPSPPSTPAAAAVAVVTELATGARLASLAEPLPGAAAVAAAAAAEVAAAGAAPGQHSRLVGGPLAAPAADEGGRVRLRVLVDGSALEVFTGSGEVGASSGSWVLAGVKDRVVVELSADTVAAWMGSWVLC